MRRYLALGAALTALVLLFAAGNSFAWFSSRAQAPDSAQVGRLRVEIEYDPAVSDGETAFTATNTGSLDCYVRIGYSFVYHDADGRELLKDVGGISLGGGSLAASGGEARGEAVRITETAGGFAYEKNLLLALRDGGGYYRLAPGETLTGRYAVEGISLEEGQQLRVSWVAEAIQCSEQALADAREYGWDPALA